MQTVPDASSDPSSINPPSTDRRRRPYKDTSGSTASATLCPDATKPITDCVPVPVSLPPDRASAIAAMPTSPSSRSEEHTSELQSLMRISYAVFCLKKKQQKNTK